MGETRVDLLHLLEDLRDAYPASLQETILSELVANALDSGASRIDITCDLAAAATTVIDNGHGMSRRDLARFHDIAASTKARGAGIGFAGVGVKLGLLEASEVLTETSTGARHHATTWRLKSSRRAPWEYVDPPGLVGAHGTAVRLTVPNGLSPLLDIGFAEMVLRRQFAALLDPAFAPILGQHYPAGVTITMNRRALEPPPIPDGERAELAIRLPRHRKPGGIGYLARSDSMFPESGRGVAISTYGKVILRGWDWLGISPAIPESISGIIEVPDLAACLQTNKAGFIREGPLGERFLRFRDLIQRAVAQQLALWGADRAGTAQPARRNVRPVERDLERIVSSLASSFPLLTALGDQLRGGQYRLPQPGAASSAPDKSADTDESREPAATVPEPAPPRERRRAEDPLKRSGKKRKSRLQVRIGFEQAPGSNDLARLADAVVWINEAHPAWQRAVASRSTGYHLALSCCLAMAPLAAPGQERPFINSFLANWGEQLA
jgi:hypothetical protein